MLLKSAGHSVTTERRRDYSRDLGPRAARTRQRLIECARTLFYERGYVNTTVSDVAEAAGCSLASFYSYFADINDVLRALVLEFIEESARREIDHWHVATGRRGLHNMVSAFVAVYYEYREFMELYECAKILDPQIRELGLELTAIYKRRNARSFDEAIAAGIIRNDHAASDMADALTTMLERYCYHHIVLLRDDLATVISAVSLLTDLWADSIKLVEKANVPA